METNANPWPANVIDLLLDAVFLVDMEGRVVQVSAACERIFGYAPSEMIGRSLIDFIHPEDRAKTMDEARLVMAGRPRVGFENRYLRKDGRLVHIMWSALLSSTDRIRIGVARDVTEGKLAHARQAATYAISEAVHASADLATVFDHAAEIVAELIPIQGFGVAIAERSNDQPGCVYHARGPAFPDADWQWARGASGTHITRRAPAPQASGFQIALPLTQAGRWLGCLLASKGVDHSPEDIEFLSFIAAQIAVAVERKNLHEDLLRVARYDELTGLPNRRLFLDRIRSALARARRKRSMLALFYLDVDNFKLINDTLGHAAGDAVLSGLAQRLKGCMRESDTVSRLGGDEFVILIEDVQTPAVADSFAQKIIALMDEGFAFNQSSVTVDGVSVGLALYPRDGEDEDTLLAHADREMYRVKRGRSHGNAAPLTTSRETE